MLVYPTVINPKAKLHPTVQVGAYAVIGENVEVDPKTTIGSRLILEGLLEIGKKQNLSLCCHRYGTPGFKI